jgi:hypothetical protein
LPTESLQYRDDFSTGSLQIIVHHDVGGQFMAFFELRGGTRKARSHVSRIISSGAQTLFEQFHRRRQDEEHDGRRVELSYLLSSLDLDLEEHIGSLWCLGERRAVEVTVELGPLEELASLDRLFKCGAIDVEVFVTLFTRTTLTSRPTAAQPECGIGIDESARERTFADATRTNKNDQE